VFWVGRSAKELALQKWKRWGTHKSLGQVPARAWRLFSADWNNLKREASSAVTTGGHCYVAREKQRETAARAAARLEAAPEKKQGTASACSWNLPSIRRYDFCWTSPWMPLTPLFSGSPSTVLDHVSPGIGLRTRKKWGTLANQTWSKACRCHCCLHQQGTILLTKRETEQAIQSQQKNKRWVAETVLWVTIEQEGLENGTANTQGL